MSSNRASYHYRSAYRHRQLWPEETRDRAEEAFRDTWDGTPDVCYAWAYLAGWDDAAERLPYGWRFGWSVVARVEG